MFPSSSRQGTALLLSVVLGLLGCDDGGNQTAQPGLPPDPIPVGVIQAQPQPITLGESFVGRIEAVQKVEIRSRVSGFIEERLFEEGQIVDRGTPLFRIERDTYDAIVQQRRADLASAEAQAENADVQLKRAQELVKRGNIPEATVDEREAAARMARAAVLQARAALRQAEINLGYTDINAPIAGRIGRAAFDVGDLVGPESAPLTEIVSVDPAYAVFPVSQRRFLEAQQAAREKGLDPSAFVVHVRLSDQSQYPHPGRVDFVSNTVERGTDTIAVRAVLPNPDGLLRDGQFVQVVVEQAKPEIAIVVPQSAVQADRQGQFVLVVNPEGKIDMRRIETGETLPQGRVAVTGGLNTGDQVVVQGIQRVRPGTPVEPRPAEPASGRT